MPSLYLLSREMGIKIHGKDVPHPGRVLPCKETWSGPTIKIIMDKVVKRDVYHAIATMNPKTKRRKNEIERAIRKGYSGKNPDHIHAVIGAINTSEANQRMLYADVILGVSIWMHKNKIKQSEVRDIKDAFYHLDLGAIRQNIDIHGLPIRATQIAYEISNNMLPVMRGIRD